MQVIRGRLVKVVPQVSKNAKVPYKILQVLIGPSGFVNELSGEVISCEKSEMNGRECTAFKLLSDETQFAKTYYCIDYDDSRKYKIGQTVKVFGIPSARRKNGRAFVIFELLPDQAKTENDLSGDCYLASINDFRNKDWKTGNVKIDVTTKSFLTSNGVAGFQYFVA